jgi:hypothetical protein
VPERSRKVPLELQRYMNVGVQQGPRIVFSKRENDHFRGKKGIWVLCKPVGNCIIMVGVEGCSYQVFARARTDEMRSTRLKIEEFRKGDCRLNRPLTNEDGVDHGVVVLGTR